MRRAALAGLLAALILGPGVAAGQTDAEATFRDGMRAPASVPGGRPIVLPGCRDCHGRDGAGGREGGTTAPPITRSALIRATLARPAYDGAAFAAALRDGIGAGGRRLQGLMPRYPAGPEAATALWDHLGRLEASERSGVEPDRLRLGVDAAAGPGLLAALRAGLAEGTGDLRLHGRRVEIVPVRAGEVETGRLLALVFATDLSLRRRDGGMPLLFPLAPLGEEVRPDEARSAMPSRRDQADLLLAAAAPGVPVLADGDGRALLPGSLRRPLLDIDRLATALPDEMIVLIARDRWPGLLGMLRRGMRVHAIGPEIGDRMPALARGGVRLVVTDPSAGPGLDAAQAPAERLGRAAASLLRAALAAAGRDLTRGALLRAFDTLRLDGPDWPGLDYARHPRTGRRSAVLVTLE
ncbi:hypothetical protein SAMN02799631_00739 [Methylobacterium sp. 174MFSha1.1]|uniref:hypothetical protein n=1 Tax=Methylobacterium sp. 174MFSha1.1 TaxID=1502749 RepID=UPI0008F19FAD|nr:hypothetical protein [Methylobacterium sp. 174MFSha1.1]SFU46082.1 hypothetical protein SAMN02799631_00739 [Methylobacterium sp. 174MFSha1.1]